MFQKNVEDILTQLQLKYVDLMLIHWPAGYEEGPDPFPKVCASLVLPNSRTILIFYQLIHRMFFRDQARTNTDTLTKIISPRGKFWKDL